MIAGAKFQAKPFKDNGAISVAIDAGMSGNGSRLAAGRTAVLGEAPAPVAALADPNPLMKPLWNGPDRDQALVRLADGTRTAVEIGACFADLPSRSAVLGRVHRLRKAGNKAVRLVTPGSRPRSDKGKPKPSSCRPRATRKKRLIAGVEITTVKLKSDGKQEGPLAYNLAVKRENRKLEKPAEEPAIIVTRAAAFDPLPGVEPVAFADLTAFQCRWCVDGLEGPSRMFCGAPKEIEHSYCRNHARLAFQLSSERRREWAA